MPTFEISPTSLELLFLGFRHQQILAHIPSYRWTLSILVCQEQPYRLRARHTLLTSFAEDKAAI